MEEEKKMYQSLILKKLDHGNEEIFKEEFVIEQKEHWVENASM